MAVKKSRTPLLILSAIILGGILWYGMQPDSTPGPTACSEQAPQPRIVAFGDSLVVGYGATTSGGFVSMVSQDLGVPIENLGRNGDTTTSGLNRLPLVLKQNPDIVILLLGGNDALRRVDASAVENNLKAIIDELSAAEARVILTAVPGGLPFNDPYPAMFERLAESPNVTYVPNILSGIFGRRERMSDGIHPNEVGYRLMADRLTLAVREACTTLSTGSGLE